MTIETCVQPVGQEPIPDANTWRPIETAPKDQLILTYRKDADEIPEYRGMTIGGREEHFYSVSQGHEGFKKSGWTGWFMEVQPTHWMPLPYPPEDAAEGGTIRNRPGE